MKGFTIQPPIGAFHCINHTRKGLAGPGHHASALECIIPARMALEILNLRIL